MRPSRLAVVAVTVLAALLVAPAAASAHAELASSDPAGGSRLQAPPTRILLTFTESVDLGPGELRVFAPDGRRVEDGRPQHLSGRRATATVPLRSGLGEGTYTVVWLVVSADSHPVRGSFTFSIGEPSKTAPVVDEARAGGDRLVGVLLGVARWLAFGGFAVLVGGAAFLILCWPRGAALPAARRLVVAGWGALLAGSIGQALLQGPYTAGLGISQVLDGQLVATTLGTRLGHALMIRIGLLGVLGALGEWALARLAASAGGTGPAAGAAGQAADRRRRLWIGAGAAAGTVTLAATWSAADHAATGSQVALALPADVVHLTAMAVWLGGLVMLATVVLRGPDHLLIRRTVPLFSRIALGCVAVLVITGTYQSWRQAGSVGALTGTDYGQLLTVKIGLFVALVCLAAVSRQWVRERLAGDPRQLRRSVAAETLVGVLALAVTALLVNTVPARTAHTRPPVPAAAPVVNGVAEFRAGSGPANSGTVTVFVDPARPGANILYVSIWDTANAPKAVPEVRATLSEPSRGIGPLPVQLTPIGPGRYLAPALQIPLAGAWRLNVAVRTTEVDETTVTFPVRIG